MISVGSKVVCIDDSFPIQLLDWTSAWPRKGRVYTVSRLHYNPHYATQVTGPGVQLEEFDSGKAFFCLWRFRELTSEDACDERDAEFTTTGAPVGSA